MGVLLGLEAMSASSCRKLHRPAALARLPAVECADQS